MGTLANLVISLQTDFSDSLAQFQNLSGNVDVLSSSFGTLDAGSADTTEALSATAQALGDMSVGAQDSGTGVQALNTPVEALVATLDDLTAKAQESQDAFQQALSVYNDTTTAFNEGAVGSEVMQSAIEQLKSTAEEAGVSLTGLVADVKESEKESEEAGISFAELGEKLIEIAEVAGLGLGLMELGKDAISATAQVQDLSTSLSFITKSSSAATEDVEILKNEALALSLPFEQVAAAAQKMTAQLGSFDEAQQLMLAAADASRVMGTSFESATNMMDRMVLSGTMNARALTQLGLSTHDLAQAMGVADTEAAAMFKSLDQSDRVEVMVTALGKYAGASAEFAKNLGEQWQDFKTQFEFALEEVGKAVAPAASILISGLGGALNAVLEPLKDVGDAIGKVTDDVKYLSDIIPSTSESMNAFNIVLQTHEKVLAALLPAYTLITTGIKEFGSITQWAGDGLLLLGADQIVAGESNSNMLGRFQASVPILTAYGVGVKTAAEGLDDFSKQAQEDLDKFSKLSDELTLQTGALDKASAGLASGAINQNQYNAVLAAYEKALGEVTSAEDEWSTALANRVNKLEGTGKITETYMEQLRDKWLEGEAQIEANVADMVNAIDLDLRNLIATVQDNPPGFESWAAAADKGKVAVVASLDEELAAMEDVVASANNMASMPFFDPKIQSSITGVLDPMKDLASAFKTLGTAIGDDFSAKLTQSLRALQAMGDSGLAATSQLEEGFNKVLQQATKLGSPDAFGATIPVLETINAKLQEMGAPMADILKNQTAIDQAQLTMAINSGQNLSSVMQLAVQLTGAKTLQDNWNASITQTVALYNNVQKEFGTAWTQFNNGIADAIVHSTTFQKAMDTMVQDTEKKLAELAVNYLTGQLKSAIIGLVTPVQQVGEEFVQCGDAAVAAGTVATTAQVSTGAAVVATTTQVQAQTVAVDADAAAWSWLDVLTGAGAIGSIIGAGAGIMGDVQNSEMLGQLKIIANNTTAMYSFMEKESSGTQAGAGTSLLDLSQNQQMVNLLNAISGYDQASLTAVESMNAIMQKNSSTVSSATDTSAVNVLTQIAGYSQTMMTSTETMVTLLQNINSLLSRSGGGTGSDIGTLKVMLSGLGVAFSGGGMAQAVQMLAQQIAPVIKRFLPETAPAR